MTKPSCLIISQIWPQRLFLKKRLHVLLASFSLCSALIMAGAADMISAEHKLNEASKTCNRFLSKSLCGHIWLMIKQDGLVM